MKYASQDSLVQDIIEQHAELQSALSVIPLDKYREPGVWGDDWSVHDLVAHLTAWHELLLGWYRTGQQGCVAAMPAPGYKWNETPRLNQDLRDEYLAIPTAEVIDCFSASHAEVLNLALSLTAEELLDRGIFAWARGNALVTYIAANTASHYRFALKVLKRWHRSQQPGG